MTVEAHAYAACLQTRLHVDRDGDRSDDHLHPGGSVDTGPLHITKNSRKNSLAVFPALNQTGI